MLADGFKAAEIIKEKNPEAFNILRTTVLQFRDVGSDYRKFNKLNQMPIFVYGQLNAFIILMSKKYCNYY